ncbi:hypothetical protein FGO68_gene15367 [Halteria grandinella]|uniref:Uncharacterized protein n=1 Tax=Halteria grandinella TaxID=5974 RepID=A0A8J8P7W5_HALGN|nr:hypothetical protein FGO68_gene15367 [Halteria grandinella]
MDQMLKIGKSETQSPRFGIIQDGGKDFFKVKGVLQRNIFTTGKQSKLKQPKTADRFNIQRKTKKSKEGRNGVLSQVELGAGTPDGSRSVKRVGGDDLILLKDDVADEKKKRIHELINAQQSRKADSSQQRRQIQQLLINNTILTDTPGAQTAESLNKESVYTLDSSRMPGNHRMPHRLGDQFNAVKGCLTANVSLEETPERPQKSQKTVRKPKNNQSLLQGFVDKALLSPPQMGAMNSIGSGGFIKTADGLGGVGKYQNQDLTFSLTPHNAGTGELSPEMNLVGSGDKINGSILKNKLLATPSTPVNGKRNIANAATRPSRQQQRTMEIFSHEESLEKRMLYTVPKNIHNLINDIAHKNHAELHQNTIVIKQQEAVLMSKRRKAQPTSSHK